MSVPIGSDGLSIAQKLLELANELVDDPLRFASSPWEQELLRTHLAIAGVLVQLAEKIDPLVQERGA
jgi:hypothetical protein